MTPPTPPRHLWPALLWPAASGLLLMLAWPSALFPGFAAWNGGLALIGLIPFLGEWRRSRPGQAFRAGLILGFVFFVTTLSWFNRINQDTKFYNILALVFFSLCGGIYFGLFSASARWIRDRLQAPDILILPLAWTAWEYLRGTLFEGGWPWASLGHSQYANPVLRQVAAVAGVGGISFIILCINVLLLDLVARQKTDYGQRAPRMMRMSVWLTAGVWIVLLAVGIWEGVAYSRAPKQDYHLALIQGNFNTRQRWDQAYRRNAMDRMAELHQQASRTTPDLIVWAESCFPAILDYEDDADWETQLRQLIQRHGIPTVLTSNEYVRDYDREGERYHHYNSAFLLAGDGSTAARYRKIKLVPGGEYMPFYFEMLFHATVREPIPVDFEPGREYTVFNHGGMKFSPLICYEDLFEEQAYQLARRGARFFTALANDGWSGNSAMSTQHCVMTVFLAIENRAYIAKANMTGPTCVIDPWGNRTPPLPYFQSGVRLETIHLADFKPFFSRFGNVFSRFCLVLLASFLAGAWWLSRKSRKITAVAPPCP